MTKYCVIGAGAAGLSALETLSSRGHQVDCFERTDNVGGHWRHDYDALHLITSRDQTVFEGFPMPTSYPHFPRRDQVLHYIESFARARGLDRRVALETEVLSVTPAEGFGATGSAGWTVTTTSGADTYDGVLVANGHLWDPKIPSVPGVFAGGQRHSSQYTNVDDLDGSRVLVVGAGNSGCDLAVDVAQHRLEVDVVIRHGAYFQPKMYFGRPRAQLDWMADFAPAEQDLIARLLARVSIGQNSDYPGLPLPPHRAIADGPAVVNDLLLYWIHHGRIGVIGHGIERFEGHTVHFADGSAREYDTILWATGFHPTLPFLDDELVPRGGGVPLRVGAGLIPVGLEKLYYIGLTAPRGPQIPIYGVQARLAEEIIRLHEAAGPQGADVAAYLNRLQQPDTRIDIPRDTWNEQLADTQRLVDAYAASRGHHSTVPAVTTPAGGGH